MIKEIGKAIANPDNREIIRELCKSDTPSEEQLRNLLTSLGFDYSNISPGDIEKIIINLKVQGLIKPRRGDDNDIAISSWIDVEARELLKDNPNYKGKTDEIILGLEHRLAIVSEMFLTTSELLEKVKAKEQ